MNLNAQPLDKRKMKLTIESPQIFNEWQETSVKIFRTEDINDNNNNSDLNAPTSEAELRK